MERMGEDRMGEEAGMEDGMVGYRIGSDEKRDKEV